MIRGRPDSLSITRNLWFCLVLTLLWNSGTLLPSLGRVPELRGAQAPRSGVMEDVMERMERVAVDGVSADAPLRVLYIGGCGRSGSTILDTVLGNHSCMESVGEACHIVTNAWLSSDSYCACGHLGSDCDFWQETHRQWTRRVGPVDMVAYVRAAQEIESCLRPSVTQSRMRTRQRQYLDYARLTVGLLAAVRDVSGGEIVVDSSKAVSRALVLSMVEGVDLRLIHMIRDCRGVAWSRKKRFRKDVRAGVAKDDQGHGVSRSALVWTRANLLVGQLCRRLPRGNSIRLRYEDLIAQPDVELRRIGHLAGVDLETLAQGVVGGRPMTTGHTIAGNRLRMSGAVRLRPDVEWVDKLTWREQATCWALAGWLMKVYGYRWRPAAVEISEVRRAA